MEVLRFTAKFWTSDNWPAGRSIEVKIENYSGRERNRETIYEPDTTTDYILVDLSWENY